MRIAKLEKRFRFKEPWAGYAQWLAELLKATNELPTNTVLLKRPLQNHLQNLLVKCIMVKYSRGYVKAAV
jgi:hypothetical protein